MRFLIARFSSLGDVVCTLPAAVALKKEFPQSEVVWIVDPRFAGIVECCSAVDRVVHAPKNLIELRALVRDLGTFEAAFDLQGLLKSGWAVGCARAARKLGYHWRREGAWLFSQRVLPDPTSLHVTDQYLDVVRAAGVATERADFGLVPHPEDADKMRPLLPGGGKVAIMNAGAGWTSKRWPSAHFAALADRLCATGWGVAFIGGKADGAIVAEVKSNGAKDALDLTGKSSVRELVALVSQASVHIGGDTGSTHLAAALGIPAVGLYSITRPERSCPYGQRANTLYDAGSLANISVEAAFEATMRAVGHNS